MVIFRTLEGVAHRDHPGEVGEVIEAQDVGGAIGGALDVGGVTGGAQDVPGPIQQFSSLSEEQLSNIFITLQDFMVGVWSCP